MTTQPYEFQGAIERERSFIREVFAWMGGGLAVTGLIAMLMTTNPRAVIGLAQNPILFFGIIILQLVLG